MAETNKKIRTKTEEKLKAYFESIKKANDTRTNQQPNQSNSKPKRND